jgi:hypothetical protein
VFADAKLRRHHRAEVIQAASHVKDAIASLALKMMVVTLVRALVARGLAGDFDRFDLAGI